MQFACLQGRLSSDNLRNKLFLQTFCRFWTNVFHLWKEKSCRVVTFAFALSKGRIWQEHWLIRNDRPTTFFLTLGLTSARLLKLRLASIERHFSQIISLNFMEAKFFLDSRKFIQTLSGTFPIWLLQLLHTCPEESFANNLVFGKKNENVLFGDKRQKFQAVLPR